MTWYQSQTYPSLDIPLNVGDGATDPDAIPEDLTSVDITKFSMIFRNTSVSPAVDTTGTGTFSIKRNYPGEVFYKLSPADVATPFNGVLIVKAGFPPSGAAADTVVYDPVPFVIAAI